MSTPNYDAREVLETFVATLGRPTDEFVRDVRDSPTPRTS